MLNLLSDWFSDFAAFLLIALAHNVFAMPSGNQNVDMGNMVGTISSDSGVGTVGQFADYNSDADKYSNLDEGGSGMMDQVVSAGNQNANLKRNQGQISVGQVNNGNGNNNVVTNKYSTEGYNRNVFTVANIGANMTDADGVNHVHQKSNYNNGTNLYTNQ